jgi:hypothetical protein
MQLSDLGSTRAARERLYKILTELDHRRMQHLAPAHKSTYDEVHQTGTVTAACQRGLILLDGDWMEITPLGREAIALLAAEVLGAEEQQTVELPIELRSNAITRGELHSPPAASNGHAIEEGLLPPLPDTGLLSIGSRLVPPQPIEDCHDCSTCTYRQAFDLLAAYIPEARDLFAALEKLHNRKAHP